MKPSGATKLKIALYFLLSVSMLIATFAVYGGYQLVVGVPEKQAAISELRGLLRNAVQENAVAVEKNRKLTVKNNRLKVAMKFDNLFMAVADPNQIMDFETLETILTNRRDFYKKRGKEGR